MEVMDSGKHKHFTLQFWNSLLHQKCNDNHANFIRCEILRLEKEYNLIGKEPLFAFKDVRPNFRNMKPETLRNYHQFAKFELSVAKNLFNSNKEIRRKKLKVLK